MENLRQPPVLFVTVKYISDQNAQKQLINTSHA
jgi:hypothetical protein